MEIFLARLEAVFSDHKTEMLVSAAIGFVAGLMFTSVL